MTTGPVDPVAAGHGRFRASDADRERAIETLKVAFAQGRLDRDDLDQRAGRALVARTYAELGRRTADTLSTTGGAIVDATFRHAADRRAFAQALDTGVPVVFVECDAPRAVLVERARRREHDPQRVSDAGVDVVTGEAEAWEPLDEVPGAAHLALRTDRPSDDVVADVMSLLDQRLGQLIGGQASP